MPYESSGDEPHEFAVTDASGSLGFPEPFAKEQCDLSRAFVAIHLLEVGVEFRDSCHVEIFADRTRKSFCSSFEMFWNVLFFSFLCFLSSLRPRSNDFATDETTLALFFLFLFCRLDPEDDPDDDVSISEFELDDELELESEEELSVPDLDDESEAESDDSDDEWLEEGFDFERDAGLFFLVCLSWGFLPSLLLLLSVFCFFVFLIFLSPSSCFFSLPLFAARLFPSSSLASRR